MKKSLFLPLALLLVAIAALGQRAENQPKLQKAEAFRKGYHFNEAITLYKELLSNCDDSLLTQEINQKIIECENGLNMLQYALRPTLTGHYKLPYSQFHLYYPGEHRWSELPDSIMASLTPDFKEVPRGSLLYREGETSYYFSAPSREGDLDLYKITQVNGDVWSAPQSLGSTLNSSGDEIYPIISADGTKLYFSSNGHYGMGGFDLYLSNWDPVTESWETPQNMGFPFSSVEDDLLFMESEDGLESYFASNRNCSSSDSIVIYRVEHESAPIRRALSSVDEARTLASLTIKERSVEEREERVKSEVMTTPETDHYREVIMEAKRRMASVDSLNGLIAENRALYNKLRDSSDRALLEREISNLELKLIALQSLLRAANERAQEQETHFLSRGILIPREEEFFGERSGESKDKEKIIEPFILTRSQLEPFPTITFLKPIDIFDYTFRVEESSTMAPEQDFPDGLIYRIQLFSLTKQNSDSGNFKGLTPIYENRASNGRWYYYAGQFNSYEAASNALTVARRSGFPSAIIAPFNRGKSLSIKSAQNLEREREKELIYQVKIEEYPTGIPPSILALLRENSNKDIAKRVVDGREIYYIGPFENRVEAQQIVTLLNNIGTQEVSIVESE